MTSMNTKRFEDVRPGEQLPELTIPITVGLIAGGAIATRDYFPGHHDLDAARELGAAPGQVLEIVFGPYDRDTDHPWHRLERGELGRTDIVAALIAHLRRHTQRYCCE